MNFIVTAGVVEINVPSFTPFRSGVQVPHRSVRKHNVVHFFLSVQAVIKNSKISKIDETH